ncbi:signal recognition particle-docking protein FtsY [Bartonella sp. TP]|uniref:signal recognition particle-docking protein FtsY n=1 Tax=Bartonella sp. TP TaxID=3057550 RepID=UPI0025B10868|nr:signal recognition particle-docking protein FtsY [Bartonella sp. TP]MDN5248640.1 signal recognition particle-docking protein FtsY [Alphaproteobacteria bacterium]WJW79498.1 signal recognition particle-docking protein FtsY [Bartonella sp. TP]
MAIFNNWTNKLKGGLKSSATALSTNITGIFKNKKLDETTLEEFEEILLSADFGMSATQKILAKITEGRYDKSISAQEVRTILRDEIAAIVAPCAKNFEPNTTAGPHVILFVGVNGSGKTTTIGKLAAKFKTQGKKIMLAAGDTFRAAAIEQLTIWAKRLEIPVVSSKIGGDAASLSFEAYSQAIAQQMDILLIDTAGRLQNKTELMNELAKITRVLKKVNPAAPHSVLLVLDGTVGQNAISQVAAFQQNTAVTGLVMTKLDGTARGGILVAICEKFALPIYYIGVGEAIDDLNSFNAIDYANSISMP